MASDSQFSELIKKKIDDECSKIKEIELEINKIKDTGNNYRKYGLLDNSWYTKFQQFLIDGITEKKVKKKKKTRKNKIFEFKYKRLIPNSKNIDFSEINENSINYPTNFTFATETFMDLISEKFSVTELVEVKNYLYEVEIGGDCIIMKDFKKTSRYRYLILYEQNKDYMNINIDFILIIYDEKEMEEACKYILKNKILNYLKKIGFTKQNKYYMILNKDNNKIGFISCISDLKVELNNIQIIEEEPNIYQDEINFPKINSVLISLSQFKDFLNELSKCSYDKDQIAKLLVNLLENISNFKNIENNNIKPIFSESERLDDFNTIMSYIFNKLAPELTTMNNKINISNKYEQFNKNQVLEEIKQLNINGPVIQKYFFSYKLIENFCNICKKSFYIYKLYKIIFLKSIDENNQNFLYEKLFSQDEKQKDKQCEFCNKKVTCLINKNYIYFPKILIIVVNENQNGRLCLKNNFRLNNNKGIEYDLKCFIEFKTNFVYYKKDEKQWCEFNKNSNENNIESKVPIVLFFSLMSSNNNNNFNNSQKFTNNNNQGNINSLNNQNINNAGTLSNNNFSLFYKNNEGNNDNINNINNNIIMNDMNKQNQFNFTNNQINNINININANSTNNINNTNNLIFNQTNANKDNNNYNFKDNIINSMNNNLYNNNMNDNNNTNNH